MCKILLSDGVKRHCRLLQHLCDPIYIFISRIPTAFLGPGEAIINKVCTPMVHARGQILRAKTSFLHTSTGPGAPARVLRSR